MESKNRFTVRAYLELARLTDDAAKRKEYMDVVEGLLDNMQFYSTTEGAKEAIKDILKINGTMEIKDLNEILHGVGFTPSAVRRAKEQMYKDNTIVRHSTGYGYSKKQFVELREVSA